MIIYVQIINFLAFFFKFRTEIRRRNDNTDVNEENVKNSFKIDRNIKVREVALWVQSYHRAVCFLSSTISILLKIHSYTKKRSTKMHIFWSGAYALPLVCAIVSIVNIARTARNTQNIF